MSETISPTFTFVKAGVFYFKGAKRAEKEEPAPDADEPQDAPTEANGEPANKPLTFELQLDASHHYLEERGLRGGTRRRTYTKPTLTHTCRIMPWAKRCLDPWGWLFVFQALNRCRNWPRGSKGS